MKEIKERLLRVLQKVKNFTSIFVYYGWGWMLTLRDLHEKHAEKPWTLEQLQGFQNSGKARYIFLELVRRRIFTMHEYWTEVEHYKCVKLTLVPIYMALPSFEHTENFKEPG
jgi:hypothetical protein